MNEPENIKQRFEDARHKSVSFDYFLYACLEQERLERHAANSEGSLWRESSDFSESLALDAGLEKLLSWYTKKYPELKSSDVLNVERVVALVGPWVRMVEEFNTWVTGKTNAAIPPSNDTSEDATKFWAKIDGLVSKQLASSAEYYMRFLQWTYSVEVEETYVPGSRPPVGRYAPGMVRRFGTPGKSSAPANNSRGNDTGESRDEGVRAIKNVEDAIRTITKDPALSEILLAPANSFYRRMQHEAVKKAGLFSTSAGEGHDRAVKVLRIAPEGGGNY